MNHDPTRPGPGPSAPGWPTSSSSGPAARAPPPRCCWRMPGTTSSSLDRASFPSDTVSTHVIARTGMVQLNRWGLLDALHDSGAPRLTTVELDTGDDVIVAHHQGPARRGPPPRAAPHRPRRPPPGRRTPGGGPDRDGGERRRRAAGRERTGRRGCTAHDARRRHPGARPPRRRCRRARLARRPLGRGPADPRATDLGCGHVRVLRRATGPAIEYHVGADALAGVFPTHGGEACVWVCTPEEVARRHQRRGPREAVLAGLLAELTPELRRPGQRCRPDVAGARACCACRTTSGRPPAPGGRSSAMPATTATRSPATASATRSGTPSCSRPRSTRRCADPAGEAAALAAYEPRPRPDGPPDLRHHLRARHLPGPERFVAAAAPARRRDRRPGRASSPPGPPRAGAAAA